MPPTAETLPQFVDRFLSRTALAVLLIAVAYGLSAATYLTADEAARWLDRIQGVLALASVVVIGPAFLRYLRLRSAGRCQGEPEGFIADAFRRAGANAFSMAFVALIAVAPVSKRIDGLPTDFYASGVLFLALGVFSLTFFHRTREDEPDDDAFPDDPE